MGQYGEVPPSRLTAFLITAIKVDILGRGAPCRGHPSSQFPLLQLQPLLYNPGSFAKLGEEVEIISIALATNTNWIQLGTGKDWAWAASLAREDGGQEGRRLLWTWGWAPWVGGKGDRG